MATMSRVARAAFLGLLLWPAAALAQSLDEREFATLLGRAGQAYEEGRDAGAEKLQQPALPGAVGLRAGDPRARLAQRHPPLGYRAPARLPRAPGRPRA